MWHIFLVWSGVYIGSLILCSAAKRTVTFYHLEVSLYDLRNRILTFIYDIVVFCAKTFIDLKQLHRVFFQTKSKWFVFSNVYRDKYFRLYRPALLLMFCFFCHELDHVLTYGPGTEAFFFSRVFSLLQLFEVSGQRRRVCRVGCSLSYLLSDPQREGNDSHSDPHVCNYCLGNSEFKYCHVTALNGLETSRPSLSLPPPFSPPVL